MILGFVGGIASGKSSVTAYFASQRAVTTVDADVIARRIQQRPEIQKALAKRFSGCIGPSGQLDREKLAQRVFARPSELKALESIVHPPILRSIRSAVARAKTPYVLLDAPLLFERGLDELCDFVVYIACPAQTRRKRSQNTRGWSEAEHRRREENQWSARKTRAHSDFVVDNGTTPARARRDVRRILRAIEGK
jgi:dephospho-CoA kinase